MALTVRQVETRGPGKYNDGAGLQLVVTATGARHWVLRYRINLKSNEMGLGSASAGGVTLAEARDAAREAQKLAKAGVNPAVANQAKQRADKAKLTFGAFASEFIELRKPSWRNEKHTAQWSSTIEQYCGPIKDLPLDQIGTTEVLGILKPLWQRVPETASRLRGRIENILDAARVSSHRDGENPARWKGHLAAILPVRQKLTRGHHAAMPYDQLPAFICELRQRQSMAALALELCILTATRTGEVLQAEWTEIDLEKALWVIPASRMKAGIEHRIPLVERAVELLRQLALIKRNNFVFFGMGNKSLSNMSMAMLMRRMGRTETVHGFRSAFSDWVSEQTSFSSETREQCLAHQISDRADAAYRRGDQLDKRRKLLEAWAAFASPRAADAVKATEAVST
jgi:integrase